MSFALGRKCYVRNWTVTMFCDICIDGSFSAENGISFSSAFSFTAANEKYIFGRPLHQTVSVYTRQWFSNAQQSRFRAVCRCLEKLVFPWIFVISHPSSSSSSSRSPSQPLRRSVNLTISDLHSVDSRALASSWILLSQTLWGRPGGLL